MLGAILGKDYAKIGVGAAGGGSLMALILGLYQDINHKIEKQDLIQKERVMIVVKSLEDKIFQLKDETKETNQMVKEMKAILVNMHKGG